MHYLHNEFHAKEGDVVEVFLDAPANVQLLRPEEYEKYATDQNFRYRSGYAKDSPFRIEIPETGSWHLTVDLGGGPGSVRSSFRLLSQNAEMEKVAT